MAHKDLFEIEVNGTHVKVDMFSKYSLSECEKYFKEYVINHGYNYRIIIILTALIYLNMAPLHHHPFSEMLFHFGKLMLYNILCEGV
jgi:hypothetical protein